MTRLLAVGAAALVFVAAAVVVTRWLGADAVERAKVERLLRAQARGDAGAMAVEVAGCDAPCRAGLARLARRLRGPGELEVVRLDSDTAHALGSRTGPTRVVWRLRATRSTLPTVQCVRVRRTGSALTGPRVTLLGLSAPIGRLAGC